MQLAENGEAGFHSPLKWKDYTAWGYSGVVLRKKDVRPIIVIQPAEDWRLADAKSCWNTMPARLQRHSRVGNLSEARLIWTAACNTFYDGSDTTIRSSASHAR